jgi:replicative superfamily II helicase
LCQLAADVEAGLSLFVDPSSKQLNLALLKSIILYDLAGYSGASASYASRNGFDVRIKEFLTREKDSVWGALLPSEAIASKLQEVYTAPEAEDLAHLLEKSLGELAADAGIAMQRGESAETPLQWLRSLQQVAADYDLSITGDDINALARLLHLRNESATLHIIPRTSSLEATELRAMAGPVELWPAQIEALNGGLLDSRIKSFGFAAPTGTGKTALARVVIADEIMKDPSRKAIYISPSRALVRQVAMDVRASLEKLEIRIFEAGAHVLEHDRLPIVSESAHVLVFTPERADLLLRVNLEFLKEVGLIVVDEAHHIEQGSRAVLLEFYLWRLRKLVPTDTRIVQLSAVAPNISELTEWVAQGAPSQAVVADLRTSRLRVGVLERTARGAAVLRFGDTKPYQVLPEGTLPRAQGDGLAILANNLSRHGIVLVLCSSPSSAERVAKLVAAQRSIEQPISDDVSERLDAWIERELYPESELRGYYRRRVIFHHAQMPPRVRAGLEEAIRERKVDVICATTTLAEGVNFPFSTVIVETLVTNTFQISPRALWNIAGRAGRFGVDSEGHCILFRPELWELN